MMKNKVSLTIFFDGKCPVCRREIVWLKSRNNQNILEFQNIHEIDFDSSSLGVSLDDLMSQMHGLTADNQLIKGIDVFALAYAAVGLHILAVPLNWRWMRPFWMWLYGVFARYRQFLARLFFTEPCSNDQCSF